MGPSTMGKGPRGLEEAPRGCVEGALEGTPHPPIPNNSVLGIHPGHCTPVTGLWAPNRVPGIFTDVAHRAHPSPNEGTEAMR